jgi:hypothetical protein
MINKKYLDYSKKSNKLLNLDLIETDINNGDIKNLLLNNKLISSRLGNVESCFLLRYIFNHKVYDYHFLMDFDIDYYMRQNAGLYYRNSKDRNKVLYWWSNHTLNFTKNSTLISMHQGYDFLLWSYLNLKQKYYRWDKLYKIILQNSKDKKILYVGSAVNSIKIAYERGVQNAWKFIIPKFNMYYVKTPQTTTNMDYPNESIIETTYEIINEIINNYSDFDTMILGCGAYGPPIMNILRKKLKNKNMIYLGSMCYEMFGIYSKGINIPINRDVIKENWIPVQERCEDHKCMHIDNGKYWA